MVVSLTDSIDVVESNEREDETCCDRDPVDHRCRDAGEGEAEHDLRQP